MNYSKDIDRVIYGEDARNFGPYEWADLAIASADQAGLSARDQDRTRQILYEDLLYKEQSNVQNT
jgi:hypothetical protein